MGMEISGKPIVVKRGDTLAKIAKREGVKLADIERASGKIKNQSRIYAGETLILKSKPSPLEQKVTAQGAELAAVKERAETLLKKNAEDEEARTKAKNSETFLLTCVDDVTREMNPKIEKAMEGKTAKERDASLTDLKADLADLKVFQQSSSAENISPAAKNIIREKVAIAEKAVASLEARNAKATAAEKKAMGELNTALDGMADILKRTETMKPEDRAEAFRKMSAQISKFTFDPALPPQSKEAGQQNLEKIKSDMNHAIVAHCEESELDRQDNDYLFTNTSSLKDKLAEVEKQLAANPRNNEEITDLFHDLSKLVRDSGPMIEDPMVRAAGKAMLNELHSKFQMRA